MEGALARDGDASRLSAQKAKSNVRSVEQVFAERKRQDLPFLENLVPLLQGRSRNGGLPELRRRIRMWRIQQQFERGLPPAGEREDCSPRVAIQEALRHIAQRHRAAHRTDPPCHYRRIAKLAS